MSDVLAFRTQEAHIDSVNHEDLGEIVRSLASRTAYALAVPPTPSGSSAPLRPDS